MTEETPVLSDLIRKDVGVTVNDHGSFGLRVEEKARDQELIERGSHPLFPPG